MSETRGSVKPKLEIKFLNNPEDFKQKNEDHLKFLN